MIKILFSHKKYYLLLIFSILYVTPVNAMMLSQEFILSKGFTKLKKNNFYKKYQNNNKYRFYSSEEQNNQAGNQNIQANIAKQKKTVRILSIDGGGIRAIIPLYILKEIEARTEKPLVQLFDVIAGTSSGGMISLALNVSREEFDKRQEVEQINCGQEKYKPEGMGIAAYSAKDILRIYEENAESIFGDRHENMSCKPFNYVKDTFRPRHSIHNLQRTLSSYFKDIKLSEALSTVMVTAYEIQRGESFLFNTYDAKIKKRAILKDFYMKDSGLATSAAPTYFSPVEIQDVKGDVTYHFVDGGIVSNNPTLIAYNKAKRLFPDAEDFFSVSLGTGEGTGHYIDYEYIKNKGLLKWAPLITPMLMHATSDSVQRQILDIIAESMKHPEYPLHPRYHRLNIPIDNELLPLDKIDEKHIAKLKIKGMGMLGALDGQITTIIAELIKKRDYATGLGGNVLVPVEGVLGGNNLNESKLNDENRS